MEQFYFVIAVLVIGFLNWIVKKIQEGKQAQDAEALRREMESLDPQARAELERRNTQPEPQPEPQRQPQRPAQPQPNQLREIMGELLGIPQEAKSAPPPLPVKPAPTPPRTRSTGAAHRAKPAQKAPRQLTTAEKEAAERFGRSGSRRDRRLRDAHRSNMNSIRKLIAEPGGLQKAVLLREILGPPQSMKP